MKRPWMKFCPSDWRADPRLRMCSLAARGLWIDLMSYMHEGQPYGYLTIDGAVPDLASIAALVARPVAEVRKALAELESKQVFSRATNGAIYSRRMVRDEAKALKDSENGKIGGNPKLKEGVNPRDKAQTLEARIQSAAADAHARDGGISPVVWQLASDLAVLAGHAADPKDWPPGWCGAPHRISAWLTAGYTEAVIRAGARACAAKKRTQCINRADYFEGAIREEHERQLRPTPPASTQPRLPLGPVVVKTEPAHGQTAANPPATTWQQSRDNWRSARAELKAGLAAAESEADRSGESGGPPVRLIAAPGRG